MITIKPIQEHITKDYSFKPIIYKNSSHTNVSTLHWHTNAEICYITEGQCSFIINGISFVAEKGDVVVINSGQIHQFVYKDDCTIIVCTSNPMFFYNLKININAILHHITKKELENAGIATNVTNCFEIMGREINVENKYSEIIFKANLLELYGVLLKHFEQCDVMSANKFLIMIKYQKILEYISENYTENISLETLSAKFNYSTAYISAMLCSYTGVNFKSYLDNIRIQKAIDLLLTTDMPITEISSNVGYENIRTFNNVFKKLLGKTPTDYKKEKKLII